MRLRFVPFLCAALMAATPLTAQTQPAADEPPGGSIIVEGSADEIQRLKESIRTGFSTPTYRPDVTGRMFETSERAARCAAGGRLISLSLLRGVVDGVFNSPQHDLQQEPLRPSSGESMGP